MYSNTFDELREVYSYVSQHFLYEIVTAQLGYRKNCASCVPRMLTYGHSDVSYESEESIELSVLCQRQVVSPY
jgi:hypothetical protein